MRTLKVFGACILGFILAVFVFIGISNINCLFSNEKSAEIEQMHVIEEDTPEITIEQILAERNEYNRCLYYDSVYRNMPEIPLIGILIRFGTEMSAEDIAKEYLRNKRIYDNVEYGAMVHEKYLQIVRRIPAKPDTISRQAPIDNRSITTVN